MAEYTLVNIDELPLGDAALANPIMFGIGSLMHTTTLQNIKDLFLSGAITDIPPNKIKIVNVFPHATFDTEWQQDQLLAVGNAINHSLSTYYGGEITTVANERIVFRLIQSSYFEPEPGVLIPNVLWRYYSEVSGALSFTGITSPSDDLIPNGTVRNEPENLIDLGDIGVVSIESAFNADAAAPFTMDGNTFIVAIQGNDPKIWKWVGGDGLYGGGSTAAVAQDFLLLTQAPEDPLQYLPVKTITDNPYDIGWEDLNRPLVFTSDNQVVTVPTALVTDATTNGLSLLDFKAHFTGNGTHTVNHPQGGSDTFAPDALIYALCYDLTGDSLWDVKEWGGGSSFEPVFTPNTATEITLNKFGNYCNSENPSTEDTFTIAYTNEINPVGEYAKLLIDTTGKTAFPSFGSGVRKLKGDTFEANELFVVKIYHDGFALNTQFVKVNSDVFEIDLLFITSPTPRTEINSGDTLNPTVIAEGATSVEFYYKNVSNVWVKIDDAVNTSGDIWEIATWSPTVAALSIKAIATYSDGTTNEVENMLFSRSIYDTFTDTDGTLITAHTPNSLLTATAWQVTTGDWVIQSNQLAITTGGTAIHYVFYDLEYKDAIFRFTSNKPSLQTLQVLLRYEDDNNFILLFRNSTTTTSLTQRIAGVDTVFFSDTNSLFGNGDAVELWCINEYIKIIVNDVVVAFIDIPTPTTHSKFGFRRGGAASTTTVDNVAMIPIAPQPIDASVTYTATKLGSAVIAKGDNAPKDSDQIGDFDIATVGSTNYLLYSARDSGGVFNGLCLATSPIGDPHNWTIETDYALTVANVAGCGMWWDGSLWHVVYTDRTVGQLLYATGATLMTLTPQGVIKDLTGSGLYIRQSSIIFENGTWYVFSDIRYDQVAGEFGYIGVFSGSSLTTLGDVKEVLSNVGYYDESCNLTGVSVKKNESNGYYEMFYTSYIVKEGSNFITNVHLAISDIIDGKYQRTSQTPLVDRGGTSFDDLDVGAPCRMPNTNFLYYVFNGTAVAGAGDGITYATLN